MRKVVSANYRDRKSELCWLIRGEDEPLDCAVPVKFVRASGVRFVFSNTNKESGFGCAVVALCESAIGSNESIGKHGGVPLKFNFDHFTDTSGKHVDACHELHLISDRKMFAVIDVPTAVDADTRANEEANNIANMRADAHTNELSSQIARAINSLR